jgi:hypothetical protein
MLQALDLSLWFFSSCSQFVINGEALNTLAERE